MRETVPVEIVILGLAAGKNRGSQTVAFVKRFSVHTNVCPRMTVKNFPQRLYKVFMREAVQI